MVPKICTSVAGAISQSYILLDCQYTITIIIIKYLTIDNCDYSCEVRGRSMTIVGSTDLVVIGACGCLGSSKESSFSLVGVHTDIGYW